MAIYPPEPKFRDSDKKLLMLMGRLLLEYVDQGSMGTNVPANKITLTDSEATALLEGLETLSGSREFREASYFVEAITSQDPKEEIRAREIYLSGRQRRGRSRILATADWLDFKARLGIGQEVFSWTRRPGLLDFTRLQNMERRLLLAAGLDKRAVDIAMVTLVSQKQEIEELRNRRRQLRHGIIRNLVLIPFHKWRDRVMDLEISKDRITAAILIVTDVSVLFTTRDWNVVGTLSSLAGAANQMLY